MSSEWDEIGGQPEEVQQVSTATPAGHRWSPEQMKIAAWAKQSKSNGRVVARAGSGKTSSIEGCVIPNAPEGKQLYVVFNRKNKEEAERKIKDPRVEIKTFNGLGYSFVRNQWKGVKPEESVETERVKIAAGPKIPWAVIGEINKLVAWAKNCEPFAGAEELIQIGLDRGIEPDWEDQKEWPLERCAQIGAKAMELAQIPGPTISYNDQIWLPVVLGWARAWWDLVIVDEAQDINQTQLLMIGKCVKRGGRVLAVGDDRQSLYSFRGAMQSSMETIREKFQMEEMTLTTTYRCARRIVEVAREIVPDFKAAEDAPEGVVRDLIGTGRLLEEARVGDAILSRVNAPLMPLCLGFLKRGIPARIEGRDIGKALHATASKWKARTVPEFLGAVKGWAQKKVQRVQAKGLAPDLEAGQIEGIQDQAAVFYAVAEEAKNVEEVMGRLLSLFADSSGSGPAAAIVLSSVHRAKGLEWDRVYVLATTLRTERGGEEANVTYVATTRARRELVMVW